MQWEGLGGRASPVAMIAANGYGEIVLTNMVMAKTKTLEFLDIILPETKALNFSAN